MDYSKIKAIAFDLDGTIYYADALIDGANEAIKLARVLGLKVFFLTNNSTKSRAQIYSRLRNMNIDCDIDEIYSSGYAAALYVKSEGISEVYISGSSDLKDEFRHLGIKIVNSGDTMIIGYDSDYNYERLINDFRIACDAEKIIACNKERSYPGKDGKYFPGCGAIVSSIEWCSNNSVDYIVGKPEIFMLKLLLDSYHYKKEELLVVGDTYESDIAMANAMGCPSVFIGKEKYADTICIKSIKELYIMLNGVNI